MNIQKAVPTRQAIVCLRLFVLLISALVVIQAIRFASQLLTDFELRRRTSSTIVLKSDISKTDEFGVRRVDLDPELRELEAYIFQSETRQFALWSEKDKTHNDSRIRRARLLNADDIKLLPTISVGRIQCQRFIENDTEYMKLGRQYMHHNVRVETKPLRLRAGDCPSYVSQSGYVTSPMTETERSFPIAYSLLVYKDSVMAERILRSIYRPQNFYCIHVDRKADQEFYDDMTTMANCFENVFIASRRLDVRWGTLSLLMADLVCMRDLLGYGWEYYINLTGQEFPIRNNFELVEVLRALRGSNDLESTLKNRNENRYGNYHDVAGHRSGRALPPVPLNITVVKGNMHGSLSRGFVDFLLNDVKSKHVFDWIKHTGMPEETYFATVNSNSKLLGAPGSYTGDNLERGLLLSREIRWYSGCGGKLVRGVCVSGIADLKRLTESPKLFLNKFHLDYEYLAFDCFEQWFYNRSRYIYSGEGAFDLKPYETRIKYPTLRKMKL